MQITVRVFYLLTALCGVGFGFICSTYSSYLLSKGMGLFEISLINAFFFGSMFLFEIPTGIFADLHGKKASFVVSCFLMSVSFIIYGYADCFWEFAVGEIIGAIGATFSSGAYEAWLKESLLHHGFNGETTSIFAKNQQISQASSIAAAISGAYLFEFNPATPWLLGGLMFVIAGIVSLFLMKEDYFSRRVDSVGVMGDAKSVTLQGVKFCKESEVVKFVIAIGAVYIFSLQSLNMQWQPFFSEMFNGSVAVNGPIYAFISLAIIFGGYLSSYMVKKTGCSKQSLLLSQLAIGVFVITTSLAGSLSFVLPSFFLHEMARGVFGPIKQSYLNDSINSSARATILSLDSMVGHVVGFFGLLFSGFLAQLFGIRVAWFVSGVFLVVVTVIYARKIKK